MPKNKEKAGTGRKIVISLVILLLLLTAGAYGYGVYYFSSHFLPGSMVNGFNCSYMTREDTESLLDQRVKAYVLAVETMKNGQEAISAKDVDLSYVSTGIIRKLIRDQERFTWFLAFNQNKNYDISESLSYNTEMMSQAVDNLKCMQADNIVQPVDAQIQDTGECFEIIPEVTGNALDRTKTEEVIAGAMLRGRTSVNLEEESCYLKPSIYSTDTQLQANCEKMNQLCDIIITYDFADRTETVDRTVIKNWFGFDENGNVVATIKDGNVAVRDLDLFMDVFCYTVEDEDGAEDNSYGTMMMLPNGYTFTASAQEDCDVIFQLADSKDLSEITLSSNAWQSSIKKMKKGDILHTDGTIVPMEKANHASWKLILMIGAITIIVGVGIVSVIIIKKKS